MAAADAILTERLSKTYGGRSLPIHPPWAHGSAAGPVRALKDLTIAVHEGEIFGFLGPNGAGKSTTIRILLGYLHATGGRAVVLGLDAATKSVEIRGRVGYLPGGIALYDTLTGEALLDYLGEFYGHGTPMRAELVERMELSERDLKRPVRDYSRGMRQKIGIVQAFQHNPELLVLDEPTEGLDPLMQRAFYDLLDDIKKAGKTVFFSSHVLSEVERVCDRVAIIRSGELVALSNVDELLARRRRHVEIRFDGEAPRIVGIEGITDVVVRDGRILAQLQGDATPFLAALQGHHVTDLLIEPARLEDAFLEYYEQDKGGAAA
jgi:ABC-2 type transport system ATP-binding protein